MKNDCWLIKVGGYEATIDPNGLIIDCHKRLDKIKYLNLKDVFYKYNKKVKFERIKKISYPIIVGEDKFEILVKKNPVLNLLKEKFNCEIY